MNGNASAEPTPVLASTLRPSANPPLDFPPPFATLKAMTPPIANQHRTRKAYLIARRTRVSCRSSLEAQGSHELPYGHNEIHHTFKIEKVD